MPEPLNEPDNTPALRRPISSRAMEILVLLTVLSAIVFILITPITCGQHGHPRWIHDLANARQLTLIMTAYAADHDGQFPTHIKLAEDYWADDAFLISIFDSRESLAFDETIQPGWYPFGSYWFYACPNLTLDDIDDPASIMLVYRAPREEHDAYAVGFIDGSAQILSHEEFNARMDQHNEVINILNASSE